MFMPSSFCQRPIIAQQNGRAREEAKGLVSKLWCALVCFSTVILTSVCVHLGGLLQFVRYGCANMSVLHTYT